VVDDEPDTLDFLVTVLEGCGAEATTASSATEASVC
jgi:CheY-like chemotaxis protein